MTDEEIVKRAKDAEKRTGFGELVHSPISKGVNSAYGIGYIEGMVEYRNSLQEEPVSEELDEEIRKYLIDFKGYPHVMDEEIRKALVRFHKSTIDIDGIKGADILAWLEKQQGEQKTDKCCGGCNHFKYETTDGSGWCEKGDTKTYCGFGTDCNDFEDEETIRRHYTAVLIQANRYRRDQNVPSIYRMPNPRELGKAIDYAIKHMKGE